MAFILHGFAVYYGHRSVLHSLLRGYDLLVLKVSIIWCWDDKCCTRCFAWGRLLLTHHPSHADHKCDVMGPHKSLIAVLRKMQKIEQFKQTACILIESLCKTFEL